MNRRSLVLYNRLKEICYKYSVSKNIIDTFLSMSEIKKKRPVELAKAPSGSSITAINEVDPHTQKILKIRELMKLRDSARTHGEFGKSDSIRDHLVEKYHIDIIDQKDGPSGWKFKDGSSNKINANTRVPKAEDGRIQVVNNSRKKRDRDEEIASSLHTKKQKSDPQLVGIATSSKKGMCDIWCTRS